MFPSPHYNTSKLWLVMAREHGAQDESLEEALAHRQDGLFADQHGNDEQLHDDEAD